MDTCFPDWNTEVRVECPVPSLKKPLGLENELVELLWKNGGVVLNTQTDGGKQSKQVHKQCDQPNPGNLIRDYRTIPWIDDCPIDGSFEKEFYANLLSEIPLPNPVVKNDNDLQPVIEKSQVAECSVRMINSSHCESNQVVNHDMDMSWASSSYGVGGGNKTVSLGVEMKYGRNVSPPYQSTTDKETLGRDFTSCSGGSGSSSFRNRSNETNTRKRKTRDAEESECRSDAIEMDSGAGNKSSQKPGMTGRSRVAEVHNMSERRRRDRINERMKALQELIPHSNKSDKTSMLDEAIEYMKSLQWQLQMMWMGSGMAPMMVPGMQHYMSRFGMGMGPPMHPGIQNLMRLSRMPRVDQAINMAARTNQALVNYQNQIQNYMGLHSVPNALQPTNMFPFGFHSAQQNMVLTPPDIGNGSHASIAQASVSSRLVVSHLRIFLNAYTVWWLTP